MDQREIRLLCVCVYTHIYTNTYVHTHICIEDSYTLHHPLKTLNKFIIQENIMDSTTDAFKDNFLQKVLKVLSTLVLRNYPNSERFTSNQCTPEPCHWKMFIYSWLAPQWTPGYIWIQAREWEGGSSEAISDLSKLKYYLNTTPTFSLWELCQKRTATLQ